MVSCCFKSAQKSQSVVLKEHRNMSSMFNQKEVAVLSLGIHKQHQFSSVQLLSHVWLFAIPWTAARQASRSITNSRRLPKLMSIESVMPSNHLILCCPLLLLPSIFPSIRVFSNESAQMSLPQWCCYHWGRCLAYLIKSLASLLACEDSFTVIQSPLEVK